MVPPVAAPDEIVELHDALVATPLDDVETLRRLAWRARMIAAKRPRDYVTIMTTAKALALNGEHDQALEYARRAFDLRVVASQGRDALAALCLNLGLLEQARVAAEEICALPAYSSSKIAMDGAAAAAFLVGDVELLARTCTRASGLEAAFISAHLLRAVADHDLTAHLSKHMAIFQRHVAAYSCQVAINVMDANEHGDKLSIHIQHRLALELRPCLNLFNEMSEALENYYLGVGREDMAYGEVIVHGFAPMPAFRVAAA